jgi:hypothetical protein
VSDTPNRINHDDTLKRIAEIEARANAASQCLLDKRQPGLFTHYYADDVRYLLEMCGLSRRHDCGFVAPASPAVVPTGSPQP